MIQCASIPANVPIIWLPLTGKDFLIMLAGFQNKIFGLFRIGTGHEPAPWAA